MSSKVAKNASLSAILAAIAALGGGLAPPAFAQSDEGAAASDDGAVASDDEAIVVVGSRIRRRDERSASPIQTLDADELRIDGSVSLGDTLQTLPTVGPSLNLNGSAGTSHGSSSLNLRSLGENRGLVLVNGHRWVNGAGTRGFRDFVDLNTIPQAMIERVEVLQDGATAIYGADAIAGVVNFISYRDFEGARLSASYGQTDYGDRETSAVEALLGRTWGRSNWMLALSHTDRNPIYTQDRDLTRVPLNGLTLGTPEGLFRENGLAGVVGFPVPTAGITRDPGVDGSVVANWRPANAATDVFNQFDRNYVVGPSTITSIYLQNHTELTDALDFHLEVLYNERQSDQLFSGAAPVIRGSRGFRIANNPLVNPFGIEFSGSDFRVDNFFEDVGQRDNIQHVETLRLGFGFSGELENGWAWDAFASWAENSATFTSVNQVDLDRLALGMRACDTTGIVADVSDLAANCTPVNLFNPLTPEMADYIRYTGRDENAAEQIDFTANLTGDLMQLPAGALAFAAGYEYRQEEGRDSPDSYINATPRVNTFRTTTSAPREGTEGEYYLNEVYTEFDVPLLADQPFARDLSIQAAVRYSDYSTFGDTTNGKVALLWRPADDIMFRSTWAQGFRAPSILELFEGSRQTVVPVSDPCSGGGVGLPGCAGVPSGYIQPAANVPATVGGNPDLEPETSENISIGLVATPRFLPGASLTFDWYNIQVDDTISTFGAQNLLDLCATTGQNCSLITREASGEIENVLDGPVNLNSTEVEGFDIVARYNVDNSWGTWDFTLSGSRLLNFSQRSTLPSGALLETDKTGSAASRESYPEWRAMFTTQWSAGPWSSNYQVQYIGETEEAVGASTRSIEPVVYHDLSLGYNFTDSLAVRFGIDNLFDEQPPTSLTNLNINFDITTYNPVGRFGYLRLTWDLGN